MTPTKEIVTLPGDGIGPEVTEEAVKVLEAACKRHGFKLKVREYPIGGISIDKHDTPLTEETIEACKKAEAVFLGAVGGPKWDSVHKDKRPEAGLLQIRSELGLFANLRPIKIYKPLIHASPLKEKIIKGTDILIVRELTGGIYFGRPRLTMQEDKRTFAVDTMEYDSNEIMRIAHKAFDLSRKRNSRVCSVDKSNVLDCSRLWRDRVEFVSQQYQDVELKHMLVDNCAMQLLRDPKQFDVIVTGNMFGDILSDEAAMLTGSIGMLPSASLGESSGLYEPVHGSAPDIAGKNKANPLAAIASMALMCRYSLDMAEAADEIDNAIMEVLKDGFRTPDIYSGASKEFLASTDEIGSAVLKHLSPHIYPGSIV